MKIFLCIVIAVILIFIIAIICMAVKYPHIHWGLRLIGWFYTKFNSFDSMEGMIRYAGYINKSAPKRVKNHSAGLNIQTVTITGREGNKIPVVIYKTKDAKPDATGLFWIHGGACAYGAPGRDRRFFAPLAKNTNTVVVAPDYRLSVKYPYPAAFNDCCDALLWMKENAKQLGINENQIFVGGCSAGSNFAAALTLYERETKEVNIAYQIIIYPMLNDKMDTPSMTGNTELIWNETENRIAWQLYLRDLYAADDVPVYAAPFREKNLSGLPPAYTFVGTLDPLYDEARLYMERLASFGVETVCDVYEGAYHGFDAVPSRIAGKARKKFLEEYKKAVEKYFALQ